MTPDTETKTDAKSDAEKIETMFPDLDFDPLALRQKYRSERDKRTREEGEDQYIEAADSFAHFSEDDPYVEPGFTREPKNEEIEVVIIGGGFSGMMTGARMKERGLTDLRIIEAGGDFGGTWYWNRYPGAQCDIESYCYLPLLEELGYMPKEKYSFAPEIFEHSQRIGREFDLYEKTYFQTRVTELKWDESENRWLIATNRGDKIRARFVIQAVGPANRPKLPGIPGIEEFEGHSFHTCRWDYDYTGGDHSGGLTKLGDKRVAIIGTGATAIQCVPFVGEFAKQLVLFQRTPSSVDLRGNSPTDPEWASGLEPGWQRKRRENFASILLGLPFSEDLVDDGWTDIAHRIGLSLANRDSDNPLSMEEIGLRAEISDFEKMNEIRSRVESVVTDEEKAEILKPWFRMFCKRPTFNDNYLKTFNRENVDLVDVSAAKGVERITKDSIIANGVTYPVDCIIYATGFEITTSAGRRVDFSTVGRQGKTLLDHWNDGYRTLHGLSSNGFPNWFTIGINQNGFSPNMTAMFDDQAQHVAYIIDEVKKRGKTTVEVTAEAEESWVNEIRQLAQSMGAAGQKFLQDCTPGYYNREGHPEESVKYAFYSPGVNAFNALLAKWRESGELKGLDLK